MSYTPTYRVTNTLKQGVDSYDEYGQTVVYPEGSLAWALEQAGLHEDGATVVIDARLAGKTLTIAELYNEYDGLAITNISLPGKVAIVNEGSRPVTIRPAECEEGCCETRIEVGGSLSIGPGIALDTDVAVYGELRLDHCEMSGTILLDSGAALQGTGASFTGQKPLVLTLDNWDGSAADLRSAWLATLSGLEGGKLPGTAAPQLGIVVNGFSRDLVIDEAWLKSIRPDGVSGIALGLTLTNGETITLARGTKLPAELMDSDYGAYLAIQDGTLVIEQGASLATAKGEPATIYNGGGKLLMSGADLGGYVLDCASDTSLDQCYGTGTINLHSYARGSIRITGCDLSRSELVYLDYGEGGGEGSPLVIDLSHNYWGTRDLARIKRKIKDADGNTLDAETLDRLLAEGTLILGDFLASSPCVQDTTPPALKLNKPSLAKAGEGMVQARFSWKSEEGASYTLEIDGKTLYQGSDCETSLTLADGEHRYTLIAADKAGNETRKTGEFRFDATAPTITLAEGPTVSAPSKGKGKVALAWNSDDPAARYTVLVDGKRVYSGSKASCKFTLKDGEHSYSITATDKAGNIGTAIKGSFNFDATAPELRLLAPTVKYTEAGKGDVLLSWSCEEGATYKLTLNGKTHELDDTRATTQTLAQLADGKYKYSLTATDAAGNISRAQSGSFTVNSKDNTPPAITELKSAKLRKSGDGLTNATLSWKGEKGSTYMLVLQGGESYHVKGSSYTLKNLADGTYHYSLTPIDSAGNAGEAVADSFSTDATAPAVTQLTHSVDMGSTGSKQSYATLSWQGEAGATYTVKLGGKSITFKPDAEGNYEGLVLADGLFTYRHTYALKDGKHSYSLTATDAQGNKKTYKGAEPIITDTTAPKLSLGKPKLHSDKGSIVATLNWKGEAGARYTLTVDRKEIELADSYATSCTVLLDDGREHSYSITATDWAGNSRTITGKAFSHDATAPGIALGGLLLNSMSYQKASVTVNWAGSEAKGITYTVKVDGKQVYKGSGTRCKLNVPVGTHRFDITATDKAGNSTTLSNQANYRVEYGQGILTWVPDADNDTLAFAPELRQVDGDYAAVSGQLEAGPDTDYYRFWVDDSTPLRFRLEVDNAPATITLVDAEGCKLGAATATRGTALDQELTLAVGGLYYLQVNGTDGLPTGYRLDIDTMDGQRPYGLAALA